MNVLILFDIFICQDSEILSDEQKSTLFSALKKPYDQPCNWTLVYTTKEQGSSFNTLLENIDKKEPPYLIILKDAFNNIFGAYSEQPFERNLFFVKNPNTFVFSFKNKFKKYDYTGEAKFYCYTREKSLNLGSGLGNFDIRLYGDNIKGISYWKNNIDHIILSGYHIFDILMIEVWKFTD